MFIARRVFLGAMLATLSTTAVEAAQTQVTSIRVTDMHCSNCAEDRRQTGRGAGRAERAHECFDTHSHDHSATIEGAVAQGDLGSGREGWFQARQARRPRRRVYRKAERVTGEARD